jgi:antitoxin component YwqK of YwqJK toxin-antitoxin module
MTTVPTVSRERPVGVPVAAWWSAPDNEWVLGPKDADGELHGEIHYWRPDGTLCCVSHLRHGVSHGAFQRFHQSGEVSQAGTFVAGQFHGQRTWFATDGDTTERMHGDHLSHAIVRVEQDHVHGVITTARHFGADGAALATDGTPLPNRPEGVPEHAIYDPKRSQWRVGTYDKQGFQNGLLEVFDADGRRLMITSRRKGVDHGPTTLFYPNGHPRALITYANDQLHGVSEHYYRDGSLARRAHFEANDWAGSSSDWAQNGELIGEVTIAASAPARPPAPEPLEPSLIGEVCAEAIAALATGPISPAGVARLIAIGWGGDEDRDAALARVARRLVRDLDDPSLTNALRETGLDTAPRLLTATRLERVVAAMGASAAVDGDALVSAFAHSGGI